MRLRKGFTLIELIVVICVIFLLAGISLPLIGSSRAKAKNAVIAVFLKNCHTIYTRLSMGESPDYTSITDPVNYTKYVAQAALLLNDAQVQLKPPRQLQVSNIGSALFKTGIDTVLIDFNRPVTYNHLTEDEFLNQVSW